MEELARRTRAAFVADHVDETGRVGEGTQTAQLLALAFDLLPEELRRPAVDHLVRHVDRHGLRTGFLGVRHLLPALTQAGEVELAYRLALSEVAPSWGHMIRSGATTIWERWDSWTAETGFANPYMNSFCHSSFGTITEWLHATVGGLCRDPSTPGWRRAIVRPRPGGGVTWGRTSYDSRLGRWAVDWTSEGSEMAVNIEVPCGGSAAVDLPWGERKEIPSGSWSFSGRQEKARQ
jgi:alpha-L-rhamnosidase